MFPEKITVCGAIIPQTRIGTISIEYNLKCKDIIIKISNEYIHTLRRKPWYVNFNIKGCEGRFSTASLEEAIDRIESQYLDYYYNIHRIDDWAAREIKTRVLK